MKRLGYTRFVAQGGDWGAQITDVSVRRHVPSCSASTPTCPEPFHRPFRRHSPQTCWEPATRPRRICQLTNNARTSSSAEKAYPNLIYFNEVDKGNHFAAWQEPDLFTSEVRDAFRSLR
jgi:hypothetical protein